MVSILGHYIQRLVTKQGPWEAWRRQVWLAETFPVAPLSARQVSEQSDAELGGWIQQHRYLQAVDVAEGEPSMALMLLWEVDHGRSFPTRAEDDAARILMGFTRRLLRRVAAHPDLLTVVDIQGGAEAAGSRPPRHPLHPLVSADPPASSR